MRRRPNLLKEFGRSTYMGLDPSPSSRPLGEGGALGVATPPLAPFGPSFGRLLDTALAMMVAHVLARFNVPTWQFSPSIWRSSIFLRILPFSTYKRSSPLLIIHSFIIKEEQHKIHNVARSRATLIS
jgi:hypothetical protein